MNKYLYMVTQKRGKNLVVIIYIVEEGGTVKKRRQEFPYGWVSLILFIISNL